MPPSNIAYKNYASQDNTYMNNYLQCEFGTLESIDLHVIMPTYGSYDSIPHGYGTSQQVYKRYKYKLQVLSPLIVYVMTYCTMGLGI